MTGNYFPLLGVHALVGRTLNDADDNSEGDHPVAIVSYAWWNRALTRDPNVLGRKIKLGSVIYTIVGVAPPEFFGTLVGEAPDVWLPFSMVKVVPPYYGGYNDNFSKSLYLICRLKPGVSIEQATVNANLLFQQITRSFPDAKLTQLNLQKLDKAHVTLTPMATGLSNIRSEFSQPLKILMAVTAWYLLIACANIANLLLARATARARELAIRQALGAGRTRIVRQLLTESLLLAFAGGALGIALASISTASFCAWPRRPGDHPSRSLHQRPSAALQPGRHHRDSFDFGRLRRFATEFNWRTARVRRSVIVCGSPSVTF